MQGGCGSCEPIVYKDEQSVIMVNSCLKEIEGKCFDDIKNIINKSMALDMYCFLLKENGSIVANGRTGCGQSINDVPGPIRSSLLQIVSQASCSGNFIQYIWSTPPLNTPYIKRSFVMKIKINKKKYILGSGYGLKYFNAGNPGCGGNSGPFAGGPGMSGCGGPNMMGPGSGPFNGPMSGPGCGGNMMSPGQGFF
jgi:hypothetical protein